MEAVPRMPMVSFELKQSLDFVEFGPTLKQYIRDHYGEDPAVYNKNCNELDQLRQTAVHVSHDFMGCSTLKKYYSQLQFLQGRFPLTELGEAAIPFTWEDVHSGREVTRADVKFEQACILYNIGSLHSILGAMDTRQSADGMKVSCTHFQCAAWAFEHLRDHYNCDGMMSEDLATEMLSFQIYLMLAQAQECILEKSMADSRKSTITAKVSSQIVEFYRTSLKDLEKANQHDLLSSKRYKDWKRKIEMKILFYTCITNYYMGCQSEDQQKWGQCLAYFTLSLEKLTECQKVAKSESADVQESLRFTMDVVGGKHAAAKKDNDFVYHDKIPAADTLPEVKGASLVRGIPFNSSDPEISGPDIFQKLVPMAAHEASSLYSEEKATLMRRITSEIAEKNEALNQYLASLQLDKSQLNPEPERLPQQLLEKCAALSVRQNAIKDLIDSMGAVSNVSTEVDMGIQEIQQLLQDESKAELEFQEKVGKRATNVILTEIAQECGRFEEGHKKGSQSNTDLHKAMNTHITNLKLLSSPLDELQKALPSVDKERDPESDEISRQLNTLLSKVEEMRTQRETLEEQFRKGILDDDITGALCKQEEANKETLFTEQLKKHDQTVTFIRQNLGAQDNILRALTDTNAKFASVRMATNDTVLRREQMIRDLINSYDVYEELMAKSQRGLEFYKKLETNVGRLLARCRAVCKVQAEEREQVYARMKPKAPPPARPAVAKPSPQPDLQPGAPGGQPSPLGGASGIGGVASGLGGVASGLGGVASLPEGGPLPPANQPLPNVPTGMFDGPKLKDYLPFMKPKTFGKKDGSPPISSADPQVQNYLSQHSSLPPSGTASPVHLPQMSGSVPASPDHHHRHRMPDIGVHPQPGQQIGPDLTQGHSRGHTQQPQQPMPPRSARGRQLSPDPRGQQGPPDPRSYQGLPPDPRVHQGSPDPRGHQGSPDPRSGSGYAPHSQQQFIQPGGPGQNLQSPGGVQDQRFLAGRGQGQGQMPPSGQADISSQQSSQYVPLDQKWKKDSRSVPQQGQQMQPGQGRLTQPGQGQQPANLAPSPQMSQPSNMPQQQVPNQYPGQGQFQGQPGAPGQGQVQPNMAPQVSQGHVPVPVQQIPMSQQQYPHSQGGGGGASFYAPGSQAPQPHTHQHTVTHPSAAPSQQIQSMPATQYGQQVRPRDVTSTVTAVETPVISPGNENEASFAQGVPMQGVPTSGYGQYQGQVQPGIVQGQVQSQYVSMATGYQATGVQNAGPQSSTVSNLQHSQQQPQHQPIQPAPQQPLPQQPYQTPQSGLASGMSGVAGQPPNTFQTPSQVQQPQTFQPPAQNINQSAITSQHSQQGQYTGMQQHGQSTIQNQQLPPAQQFGTSQAQPMTNQANQPVSGQFSPALPQTQQPLPAKPQPPYQPASGQPIGQHQLGTPQPPIGPQQAFSSQPLPGHGVSTSPPVQQFPQSSQPGPQPPQQQFSQQGGQLQQAPQQRHQQQMPQQRQQMPPQQIPPQQQLQPVYQPQQPIQPQPPIQSQPQIRPQLQQQPQAQPQTQPPSQPLQQPSFSQQQQQPVYSQQQPVYSQNQVIAPQNLPPQAAPQQQPQVPYSAAPQPGMLPQPASFPSQQPLQQQQQLRQTAPQVGQFQPGLNTQQGQISQQPAPSQQGQIQNQQVPTFSQQAHVPTQQQVGPGYVSSVSPALQQTSQGYISQGQGQIATQQQQQHVQQPLQPNVGQGIGAQRPPVPSYSDTNKNRQMTQVMPQSQVPQAPYQGQGQTVLQPTQQGYIPQQQTQGGGNMPNVVPNTNMPQVGQHVQGQFPAQSQIPGQGQFPVQGQAQIADQAAVNQQQAYTPENVGSQTILQPQVLQPQVLKPTPSSTSQGPSPSQSESQTQIQGQEHTAQNYQQGQTCCQNYQQGTIPAQTFSQEQLPPGPMPTQNIPAQTYPPGQGALQNQTVPQGHGANQTVAQGPTQAQTVPQGQGPPQNYPQTPTPKEPTTRDSTPTQPTLGRSAQDVTPTPKPETPAGRQITKGGAPVPPSKQVSLDRQLSTASSLDEILSSSPDAKVERSNSLLAPKVLTAQDIQHQKEDQLKNSSARPQPKDPYKDRSKLDKFVAEVEKLAKFIEGFEKPSCSGPTPLDVQWKEAMEEQDKAGRQQKLAIARCYPMKNRDQDIMPYDESRVLITSLNDDYINASWVNDLSPACPKFIATQAPLPQTLVDFWLMVYEQGVEVLVALSSDQETGKKFPQYLPNSKGETVSHGPVTLTLQSIKDKIFWTERIILLRHSETKTGRTLVHLHYNAWPISGFPEKVSHLLQFITEVHSFYRQQRSLMKPIVTHCSNGIGRTGMFMLIYVGMQEVNHGDGVINLPDVVGKMLWRRRNLIVKKDQLKYCYEAVLYYAQDVLAKEGILVHKASFGDELPKPGAKSQSWEPGEDILFGSLSFTSLQTNVARLGTKLDPSRLDQKLEALKNGEDVGEMEDIASGQPGGSITLETTGEQAPLVVQTLTDSSLPDVVQSPGLSKEMKKVEIDTEAGDVNVDVVKEGQSDTSQTQGQGQGHDILKDLDNLMRMKFEAKESSSIGSMGSGHSDNKSKSGSKTGSLLSSPAHVSREPSSSPQTQKKLENVASSLADLQDPSTFTIGISAPSKKKTTKAEFSGEKSAVEVDPDDPLSNLDPLWTLK